MSEFAEWLSATMSARSMSQRGLAKALGIAPSTVGDWLRDQYRPGWDNCVSIARALRVDDALVRSLAGYSDVGGDTYIAEATLSPEEETIVRGWRSASKEQRQTLLGVAELILATATATGELGREEAAEPRPLRGPA